MPYVIIRQNDQEIARRELEGGPCLVGRASDCEVALHDILLSRRHCRLQPAREGWMLIDLESRNGTRVNGQSAGRHILRDGDEIQIGQTTLLYRAGFLSTPRPRRTPRPADPFEALAGTVFAHEVDDPRPTPRLSRAPRPQPAPRRPSSYEAEGVGTLVLEMLSDLHDTVTMQSPVNRQAPSAAFIRPMVRRRPTPADHARPTVDLSLQVIPDPPPAPRRPLVTLSWSIRLDFGLCVTLAALAAGALSAAVALLGMNF